MYANMFGKDMHDAWWLRELINELRTDFDADGGDALDFPKHLEQHGIKMIGPVMKIDDKWATWAELKYK
jgi:hypothetical protein